MCKALGVSESGYYRYLVNKDKPSKDEVLSVAINELMEDNPFNDNYGVPRVQMALEQRGIKGGKRRITRIMRENGWLHTKRRRPHGLTKADPQAMITENLIKQDFSAEEPYTKLLTDITQTQCKDGKLYISPILDCCNGEILSLEMRSNMKKELCIDTVKASQYTSEAFRKTLKSMKLQQSLSGVAHCYDNARMESFFATLKKELLYRIPTYRMTMEEVKSAVFRYVFTYYNQVRVYTRNPNGWPPVVYRRLLEKQEMPAA